MHNLLFAYLFIWAVILGRLGFDEWKQWRLSRAAREDGRRNDAECPTWKTATT